MDIFLIIFSGLLVLTGLAGCIVPIVPGPPLSYVGLLLLHFTQRFSFSWNFLVLWAFIVIAVTIFDYIVPAWGTKKFGGSKYGIWGAIAGLLIGLPFAPIGLLLGPFVGAVAGELIGGRKSSKEALKAGTGAFIGVISGTIIKLVTSGAIAFYFIIKLALG